MVGTWLWRHTLNFMWTTKFEIKLALFHDTVLCTGVAFEDRTFNGEVENRGSEDISPRPPILGPLLPS